VKGPRTLQTEARSDWVQRYEQLREQILTNDSCISSDLTGLSVLITQGMVAWMRAWQQPPLGASFGTPSVPQAEEALPMRLLAQQSWQEEATRLLVNMTLCHF
jgi:hypothetical protein